MSHSLTQRRFLTNRYFEVTESSLKIAIKKPFKYYEENFPFEDITKKTFRTRSPNRLATIFSCIGIVGFLATTIGKLSGDNTISFADIIFYLFFLTVLSFVFWITFTNTINLRIVDTRYIAFYATQMSTVNYFIENFYILQKRYLLDKYAKPEPWLSGERLIENLLWLRDKKIITDIEFENLKKDVLPKTGITVSGFSQN